MAAQLAGAGKREVREYADRPLEPDDERRILDAGRAAQHMMLAASNVAAGRMVGGARRPEAVRGSVSEL